MLIRRCQMGNQNVPKGYPKGNTEVIRRFQKVRQKVPKG
jgi:hypothetical protein